jgi:hypothetical protein
VDRPSRELSIPQLVDRVVQLMRERVNPVDMLAEVPMPAQVILDVMHQMFHRSYVAMNASQVAAEMDIVVQAPGQPIEVGHFAVRAAQVEVVQSDRSQLLMELPALLFDRDRQAIDPRVEVSVVGLRSARGSDAKHCG